MKAALLAFVLTAAAWAQEPSFVNEGVVHAPLAEVWKIFSTSEGYKATGVALAEVDLRIGGTIRTRYSPNGKLGDEETIENVILAYEPQRMLAIRIQKPPRGFPYKDAWKRTWTVITISDAGNGQTLVRAASMGFGDDEESQAMARFFQRGNQQTIEVLQKYMQLKEAR
ncbi:MAG: SRPBCC domain-containing protein [Acidobacteriota bacterium]